MKVNISYDQKWGSENGGKREVGERKGRGVEKKGGRNIGVKGEEF